MRVVAHSNTGMILSVHARRCVTCKHDFATNEPPPVPFVMTPGYIGFKEQVECLACVLRRIRAQEASQ